MTPFETEADWYAEVQEEVLENSAEVFRCGECGRVFQKGEIKITVNLQQYEDCRGCCYCYSEQTDDNAPIKTCWGCDICVHGSPPGTECCNFGQTDKFELCGECVLIRQIIKGYETKRGTIPGRQEPGLGVLYDELIESHDAKEYLAAILADSPSLKDHPIVVGLKRQVAQNSSNPLRVK